MENGKMEEMAANILKHLFRNKSLYPRFSVDYDFETMIVNTENQSELEKLRKNNDGSYTVKTVEHILISLIIWIHHLKTLNIKNEYFCYRGEDHLDVFVR